MDGFAGCLDSSPGNEDVLPVFFAVVNIGTRDGAGISAIHPAMQVPIVMHLPPTAFHGFCSEKVAQDSRCSAEAAGLAVAFASKGSLSAARQRVLAAEFFGGSLGDGWDGDEDTKLRRLLQQQKRENIHGKVHFFSPSQSQLFLLQRLKNEAPPEQRLLEWANIRTKRQVLLFHCSPLKALSIKWVPIHSLCSRTPLLVVDRRRLACVCMQTNELCSRR